MITEKNIYETKWPTLSVTLHIRYQSGSQPHIRYQ